MVNHILITCTLVLAVIISLPLYAGPTENGDYDLQSDTKKPSLQEQKTLLTAICANKNIRKEEGNYICDNVPDYPTGCSRFEITGINYGSFTGNNRVEAIIDYDGCEPHANEFGGSVLLRQKSGKWRVISFTPGIHTHICFNFENSLLCLSDSMHQGDVTQDISEMVIKDNKVIKKSSLIYLGYLQLNTLIEECLFLGKSYSMSYLQDWKRQGNDVVLEVRYAANVNPPKTCKDTELKQFEQTVKEHTVSGTLIYHKTENGFILAPESQALLTVLNRMNRIDDSEEDNDIAETQKSASTSDPDFRDVQWGMSVNKVKEIEKTKLISEQKGYKDILIYSDSLMGLDCHVGYVFVNDKLVRSKYIITQKHTNKNDYIYDYDHLKQILIDKYGKPEWTKNNDDKTWLNSLFKGSPEDWGKAVSAGHLVYASEWHTPKSKIALSLSGDNFEIELVIEYKSWRFGELEEKADRENAKSRM